MVQLEVLAGKEIPTDAEAVVRMKDTLPDGRKIDPGQATLFEEKGENPPLFIYVAVPKWAGGTESEAAALASCCRSCLHLAEERGLQSVDFPSVAGEYPVSQAATVMEKALMDFLGEQPDTMRVRIFCSSEQEAEVYRMTYNLWYAETKSDRL